MSAGRKMLIILACGIAPVLASRIIHRKILSQELTAANRTIGKNANVTIQSPLDECQGLRTEAMAQVGEPGMVDFTYTFGAPGSASPALQNNRGDSPCFPGLRTYHTEGPPHWFTGNKWTDVVAMIAKPAGYAHAYMEAEDLEVDTLEKKVFACSEETAWIPRMVTGSVSVELHRNEAYVNTSDSKTCPLWSDVSILANRVSYHQDPLQAAEEGSKMGWHVAGWAFDDGKEDVSAGPQASYLFQNPDTLECVLTFQGTDNWQDWFSNALTFREQFCGLTYEDESCAGTPFGVCQVRRPRGSFAHSGFVSRLRTITGTDGWKTRILPNLPYCSKLYTSGHSAGGAMAELFTACVANTLGEGDFGYNTDYENMGFIKKEPQRLSYGVTV